MKNITIVGATGVVGREIISCLEKRKSLPIQNLRLLASARSKKMVVQFRGGKINVEELTETSFEGTDIAFFAANSIVSRKFVPFAQKAGAVVIDNSSAFRLDPDVPLVVPEINKSALQDHKGIIANPNCSTIIALLPIAAINQINPIQRVVVATYQAASGAGAQGMDELERATRAVLEGKQFEPKIFNHVYAFNLFSHNSPMSVETGYNEEEMKLVNESRKILGMPSLRISATCIRVPVMRAHAEVVNVECEKPVDLNEVNETIKAFPGIQIIDDRLANRFPTPLDVTGMDDVLVGRIRHDISDTTGKSLSFFVVGDQLLKGAALNAVQIAEALESKGSSLDR